MLSFVTVRQKCKMTPNIAFDQNQTVFHELRKYTAQKFVLIIRYAIQYFIINHNIRNILITNALNSLLTILLAICCKWLGSYSNIRNVMSSIPTTTINFKIKIIQISLYDNQLPEEKEIIKSSHVVS